MKLDSLEITLENCAKSYAKGQRALEPVNLKIAAGETLVLLGPSGCGKTTTLRLIAGLEQPDAGGRVLFGADDVTWLPIESRQVGMVFQSYALFPNMSVRENIGYGLRIRKTAKDAVKRRVDELLELTRLGEFADRAIGQLSGGQRQRVALARALAPQPRALLLDEPLTALDAQLRESLRGEMDGLLRGLGVTTVYVTHDQAEAMALGDRIVVMSAGRIEQTGTPREIYYQPANAAVAGFIGTMNRLDGSWREGALHCAGGRLPAAAGAAPASELWFRPEDARVVAADEAGLRGVVAQAVFLGERTRLTVTGVCSSPLLIDVAGRRAPRAGDAVGIRLLPEAWHANPAVRQEAQ
ncbi:ABC transporter ATP-binding protein [Chromobacterium sphagni]|uniref:ABC transporter ATP-binding protein n=1 Tax=Chromobacterium sphagni TaxID=1903179 RepID=A0A1S1X1G9_9NEIS|nr:ABC transporter ATP-binding protein [Chromobacterium sphagni]OHX13371.1 ABC transporter ATP-binding protein [Chromobacterium sphagni]OHX19628.1 ABC transporter ATP-binding protein [Chromobacterium sphagni]